MPRRPKRTFTREFKAKVALDALKEHKTLEQLSQEYELTQAQVSTWKQMAKEALPEVFGSSAQRLAEQQELMNSLYEQIGRLKVELDFLKKSSTMSLEQKRLAIEPQHDALSIAEQCELLGLSRSSFYYKPAPCDPLELDLMRRMDALHTAHPFLGSRRLAAMLSDQLGDDEEESGSRAGYLYLDDPASHWPTDPTAQVERLQDFLVTQSTRGPKAIKPEVLPIPLALTPLGQPHGARRALFVQAPLRWCLCCGVAYADGQRRDFARLATLGSEGRSTATTVFATSASRVSDDPTIPAHTRKLLSFTDNRQDASLQAGHFNDFVQLVRLRAALYAALTQAPEAAPEGSA